MTYNVCETRISIKKHNTLDDSVLIKAASKRIYWR